MTADGSKLTHIQAQLSPLRRALLPTRIILGLHNQSHEGKRGKNNHSEHNVPLIRVLPAPERDLCFLLHGKRNLGSSRFLEKHSLTHVSWQRGSIKLQPRFRPPAATARKHAHQRSPARGLAIISVLALAGPWQNTARSCDAPNTTQQALHKSPLHSEVTCLHSLLDQTSLAGGAHHCGIHDDSGSVPQRKDTTNRLSHVVRDDGSGRSHNTCSPKRDTVESLRRWHASEGGTERGLRDGSGARARKHSTAFPNNFVDVQCGFCRRRSDVAADVKTRPTTQRLQNPSPNCPFKMETSPAVSVQTQYRQPLLGDVDGFWAEDQHKLPSGLKKSCAR